MAMVGLDIATDTGLAVWYPKSDLGRPLLSTLRMPSDPGEVARPMSKLRRALLDIHATDPITHLWFEAAILPQPKVDEQTGRAVMRTSPQSVYKLSALCGIAELVAYDLKAHCRQVEQQRWRKHFTGRGTGKSKDLKEAAKEAARLRGWKVANDHEADAAGVLDYGLHCSAIRVPWRDAHLFGGAMAEIQP